MVGIVSFFMTSSWIMLSLAALIFGFSISGADVAWSLWVTKFAPEERVADYMAVHTFFTGVRGIIAPLTAFWLLGYLSIQTLSLVSAVLICMATLLLLPIKEVARKRTVS
jgi:MFS family permease